MYSDRFARDSGHHFGDAIHFTQRDAADVPADEQVAALVRRSDWSAVGVSESRVPGAGPGPATKVQESEEEARRLAQENSVMADVGRIVSSSLDIDEGYDAFADQVNRLVPFDAIIFISWEIGGVELPHFLFAIKKIFTPPFFQKEIDCLF